MRVSDKILLDILTGQYGVGQRVFVDSPVFSDLLVSRMMAEKDKFFKPDTNAIILNGVTIMRAPRKVLAEIEKSRE